MDIFEGGYDSIFVLICILILVHTVLAIFETVELRWNLKLTKLQLIISLLVIWVVPFAGPYLARKINRLRGTKGDVPFHDSYSHGNINEHPSNE